MSLQVLFTKAQGVTLLICAVVIVLGLGILAIDKHLVRGKKSPRNEKLAALASEFHLRVSGADDTARLQERLVPFAEQMSGARIVSPFLLREDDAHTLWRFEYPVTATALRHIGANTDSSVELKLFGILLEHKGDLLLPAWRQDSGDPAPAPPFTLESREVLSRILEYRVSMQGSSILFSTDVETWSLKQLVEQQTSAEFHAGLFNSAMKIDVQNAVNLMNSLDTEAAPVPAFHKVGVPRPDIPFNRETGISERLSEINREAHEALAIRMEQARVEREAMREVQQKKMKELRQQMTDRIQKGLENPRE